MFYLYVLISLKNGRLYTGYTSNLRERIKKHNEGIGSKYTKRNNPYKIVFYEAFLSKGDALRQELFYKTGNGREILKDKIKESLKIAAVVQR